MSDIRNLSGISVDTGASTPISEVPDAGEVLEKDQLAFHDALAKDGEPRESQSPETRKAIKRSLDRFQASSETEGTSGSSESEIAGASRGRSTRLTTGRPAGATARDGQVSARGTRRAADGGGTNTVTARGRSRGATPAAPAAPPVASVADGGGTNTVTARGRSRGTTPAASPVVDAADADREDLVSAQGRFQRSRPASAPVGDGGDRGVPASSLPWTKQSRAIADRKLAGAAPEGALAPGQARSGIGGRGCSNDTNDRRAGRSTAGARRSHGVPNGGYRFRPWCG